MKKVIAAEIALLILLAGIMFVLLYKEEPRTDITEAEVTQLVETITKDTSVSPAGNLRIRRVFGLNASDYDLMVYYMPVETMDVCEVLIVRAEDSQLSAVKSAMEARISSQFNAFEGYGEHQVELLNKAIIRQHGNYLCLMVSETPEEWFAAYEELLGV